MQVSIALVDARTNRNLWGQQYNRKFAELILVQEEISQDISKNLRLRLSDEEKKQREARELYVKGRHYWSKRTADGMLEGIKYFERATQLDPGRLARKFRMGLGHFAIEQERNIGVESLL